MSEMTSKNGDTPQAESPHDEIVQRNFGLTRKQDDWLRDQVYRQEVAGGKTSKAELVRAALDAYITSLTR